jgi:thiamine-monophosphate kinase
MPPIVTMGEKRLIQHIRDLARSGPSRVTSIVTSIVKGIGDDCAVLRLPPGQDLLVTTDFTIENVHFRRHWHPPELVGRRCLTRGLSDIAAMGGEPRAAFLSLAVAGDVPQSWVDRFLEGLLALAREFKVPLAGGDTAQSVAGIQADIVVVGSVPRGKAILRSGAKPGQQIYVTGELGGAAAALAQLMESDSRSKLRSKSRPKSEPKSGLNSKTKPGSMSGSTSGSTVAAEEHFRFFNPQARVAVGQSLRRRGLASAMIDLSDGLSTDLEHICQESHVGAEIEAGAIPRALVGNGKKPVALELALHGGDDYELLFASAAEIPAQIAGVPVTRIGRILPSSVMRMRLIGTDGKSQPLKAEGWEHFQQGN